MTRILKNYINGQWVESKATNFEDVVNPATEEILVKLPLSTKEETHEAIEVAQTAFESWQK
ncbi:MAG: aldehyde dehydrogenase family protein, partial [Tetragenococcus koreensis]|nr:aldehyde dehydrogenase family protein [Tetragenococcus koreensis]